MENRKDERDKLLNLREEHKTILDKLDGLETIFIGIHCRYRNGDKTCGHGRFNMKKYPQHIPQPPMCYPTVCPRN